MIKNLVICLIKIIKKRKKIDSFGLERESSSGTKGGMGGQPSTLLAFDNSLANDSSTGKYTKKVDQFNSDHEKIQINSRLLSNIGDTMKAMAYKDFIKTKDDEKTKNSFICFR